MTIRILIADDHHIVRLGLKTVLKLERDLEVIAEAGTADECVAVWRTLKPDVTLLDLRMPGGGHDALQRILATEPTARILILTTSELEQDIHQALIAGAKGYALKSISPDELSEAIRSIYKGGEWIPKGIAKTLSHRLSGAELTARELQVLELLSKVLTNPDICRALSISLGTVKIHIRNILSKLEVTDRTQATSEAYRRGLLLR